MHLESSHHTPGTWQDFFKQYAMVVLSILTALGLERVAVGLHDRSAARTSRGQIEAELARNAADLAESEQTNRNSIARTRTALKLLIAQLKTPQPDMAKLQASVAPLLTDFVISAPSWQRQAWDSALSDQSAGHLPPADLNRYRLVYETQHELESYTQVLLGGEWLTQATTVSLETQLGHFDGRQVAGVLARYLLVVEQIEDGEEKLAALLTGKPAGSAPTTVR